MYWRNGEFIGVGPGAHSFIGHSRFSVEKHPREYLARVNELKRSSPTLLVRNDRAPTWSLEDLQSVAPVSGFDPYTDDMERRETLILGLRLNEGVSEAAYEMRFGSTPTDLFGAQLEESIANGLLERSHDRVLTLTTHGRLMANEVFVPLFG